MWELLLWGLMIIGTLNMLATFILLRFIIDDKDFLYLDELREVIVVLIEVPLFLGASYFILTQKLIFKLPTFWEWYYKLLFVLSLLYIPTMPFYVSGLLSGDIQPELTTWRVINKYFFAPISYLVSMYLYWQLIHI